jgi:hypothetical protein
MNQLIQNIKAWGIARGITGPQGKGTLLGQIEQAAAAQAEISTGELARQLGVSVRHARRLRC